MEVMHANPPPPIIVLQQSKFLGNLHIHFNMYHAVASKSRHLSTYM